MSKNIILLIEDDELDVISVTRSLKNLGIDYELHTAYNGIEALNLIANGLMPDVILLDLNMPKMNGLEFLQIIRTNDDLKHIEVFVMTTSADNTDREETTALGISGYIIKPLNYTDNNKRSDSMASFVQFHLRKILK